MWENDSRARYLLTALIFSLALAQPGCASTMLAVGEQPDEVLRYVEVGNYVRILTNSGETFEFEVTELTALAISGAERRIPFNDISNVEVRVRREQGDPVIGGIAIAAFVGLIWMLSELGASW